MKKKMNIRKMLAVVLTMLMIAAVSIPFASAKTLAECFTSGSERKTVSENTLTGFQNRYYKQSWGKITNYGKPHYVRAYVGNKDSGRVYSKSPHKTTKAVSGWYDCGTGNAGNLTYNTTKAYAKYGAA